ncbi:hemolysin family protein [Shewanella marina]|uniref:hemolysin family protein n=1 Tax=Shewanella marina TaxID=487319 RepID=UPI000563C6CB|nr:hemolysin family protein [Shewanella marina]
MDVALLLGLVLLNGLFAMSEIALVTARQSRLTKRVEQGNLKAQTALDLQQNPTQFLSTIQIGITAIGILNGVVGESVLAAPLAQQLIGLGVATKVASISATILVVVGITYVSIVLGELIPKRVAQFNPEVLACNIAKPISILAKFAKPFVWLLSVSTDSVVKLLARKVDTQANITEDDIHALLAEGSTEGVIEQYEQKMVRNVFRLDDRPLSSLMTPRCDIVYLDINQSLVTNLATVTATEHTRFPVCQGGLDNILGIASANTLLKHYLANEPLAEQYSHNQKAVYVPESITGFTLLEQFRASGVQIVFVVDEYGEVLGLVTLQDLLEALAGEFKPTDPHDVWAVVGEDGSLILDGLMPISELQDRLSLKTIPAEQHGHYHTLNGMLQWLHGSLPRLGEQYQWQGWNFEVMTLDGNRIDKVIARQQ